MSKGIRGVRLGQGQVKGNSRKRKLDEAKLGVSSIEFIPEMYKGIRFLLNQLPQVRKSINELNEILADDDFGQLTVPQIMEYWEKFFIYHNKCFDLIRRFLVYFPVDIGDEEREFLLMLKRLKSLDRSRLKMLMVKLIDGEKLWKPEYWETPLINTSQEWWAEQKNKEKQAQGVKS